LVLKANRAVIKQGLRLDVHGSEHEGLSSFVRACDQLSPDIITMALAEIIEEVVPNWRRELARRGAARSAVFDLVCRAASAFPDHSTINELMRRFPSLRKVDFVRLPSR
jgi:hypothetical protein